MVVNQFLKQTKPIVNKRKFFFLFIFDKGVWQIFCKPYPLFPTTPTFMYKRKLELIRLSGPTSQLD